MESLRLAGMQMILALACWSLFVAFQVRVWMCVVLLQLLFTACHAHCDSQHAMLKTFSCALWPQVLKDHWSSCNRRHWAVFGVMLAVILVIESIFIKVVRCLMKPLPVTQSATSEVPETLLPLPGRCTRA